MQLLKKTASMIITPRVSIIDLAAHIHFLMRLETKTANDNQGA